MAEQEYQFDNNWSKVSKIGPGLGNLGNTCFMNSVLQCLTYTPALINYLTEVGHKKNCTSPRGSYCNLCKFEEHVLNCRGRTNGVVQPTEFVKNMRFIFKKFKLGRQEDSHEFLRLFVDCMTKLGNYNQVPNSPAQNKKTDPASMIFSGKL